MFTGLGLPQRQWHRRGHAHFNLHQDSARRVRRSAALAIFAQRFIHDVRPDRGSGKSLQHRRELHSRPNMEKLPKTEPRARFLGLWLSPFRVARDGEEAPLCQGRHHVHQGQGRSQQNRRRVIFNTNFLSL